jgi:hypothetical protein
MTLTLIFAFFACWCLKDWLFGKGEVFQILLTVLFLILAVAGVGILRF